jgi:hypothetical protein
MEMSSLVQSIGRPGESAYIYNLPNYSAIQPIAPVNGRQGSFESGYGNQKSSSPKSSLSDDYKDRATKIIDDSKTKGSSIFPGMLLNLIA